jgi:hypothetical protein
MMKFVFAALLCCFGFFCSLAQAALPNGTWKFDRSADYYGRAPPGFGVEI